jgi:site-specific DNA-methyltransferase (adenine-specific)
MPQKKSPRNKTIELDYSEIQNLSESLITLRNKVDIKEVLNRTICQDALDALDYLPDSFVDLLFVDPPYNMNKTFGTQSFKKMRSDDYEEWIDSWLRKIRPKLKPHASIYICGDWQSSSALFRVLSEYFEIQSRITWEREKGRGAKTNWKNASEDIWFATVSKDFYFNVDAVKLKKRVIAPYRDTTGKPKDWDEEQDGNFRLTYPSNIWTDISVPFWSMPENTTHPTQKPEKLLAKIILASSRQGDVVLDPFLGSGTTSVVAKKLGRNYVGIEVDKYYACIAEKRLAKVQTDNRIQGYSDGVFWERNINPETPPKTDSRQRKLL